MRHLRCQRSLNGQPCTYGNPCSVALPRMDLTRSQNENLLPSPTYYDGSRFEPDQPWGIVSLMRACRQVYYEVAPLLYSKMHFHFPQPFEVTLFSSKVAPSMLELIKVISVDVGDFDLGFTVGASDELDAVTSARRTVLKGREFRIFVKKWSNPDERRDALLNSRLTEAGARFTGGLVLGQNVKEREHLEVYQLIVPGWHYRDWERMLGDKRDIELCIFRDDRVTGEVTSN